MPTIELTDEQADELVETLQGRIDDLDAVIRQEHPDDAVGWKHVQSVLSDILELLEIA
jgi:hypothetical protein